MGRKSAGQYIEYKKDPVTGEYNFTLVGGTLEATNAFLWTDTNIEVTVGTNGDFATLNEALEYMSKFMIIKRADNISLKGMITILSGHIIDYPINIENIDLSWVTITAVDAYVSVNVDGYTFINVFNAKAPLIAYVVFENINPAVNYQTGIRLTQSTIEFKGDDTNKAGFKNFTTNISVEKASTVTGTKIDFTNGSAGLYIADSTFIADRVNFSKDTSGGLAIQTNGSCDITATDSFFVNCVNGIIIGGTTKLDLARSDLSTAGAIKAYDLSKADLQFCYFNPSISPNIEVHNGSQVNITGSTGANPSQPLNTLTNNGIIFDTNNPVPISDIYAQRTMITQETSSSNFPTGRYVGDMLFSEPLSHLYIWNGTTWQAV
jgi:hypothetical protein